MARGRMIDKEFFFNQQVSTLSKTARLFYVGLIVISDDEGRTRANEGYLRAKIFPLDSDISLDDCKSLLKEIVDAGLVKTYVVNQVTYICQPNWDKWQPLRKDRVRPSDCPSYKNGNQASTNCQPVDTPYLTQPNPTQPNPTLNFSGDFFPYLKNEDFKAKLLGFLDERKKMRKPVTKRGEELILRKLQRHPIETAILMIEQSVMNGWQGIFDIKTQTKLDEQAKRGGCSLRGDPDK